VQIGGKMIDYEEQRFMNNGVLDEMKVIQDQDNLALTLQNFVDQTSQNRQKLW
jgi:hypothetical protein